MEAGRRKRLQDCNNCVNKLQRREIGSGILNTTNFEERMWNFQLQEEFDTCDESYVTKIVAARDILFALTRSGACTAFSRLTNKKLCCLRTTPGENILGIFYNKPDDSLITVSTLSCRATQIEYIKRGQTHAGFAIFEDPQTWPESNCTVMFDDRNGKAFVFSPANGIFKMFDLRNYTLAFSICDKNIEHICLGSGILVFIYDEVELKEFPFKIVFMEDGIVLKSFDYHVLNSDKIVHFIGLLENKIFMMQERGTLQILNIESEKLSEVSCRRELSATSKIIFLSHHRLVMTFNSGTAFVCNLRGELVKLFENQIAASSHIRFYDYTATSDRDLIISYSNLHHHNSISINKLLTGKCLARIDANVRISSRNRPNASVVHSTVKEALEDITALFYDKERDENYTGNRQGLVHTWAN